jgi:hypothetical protein
MSQPDEPSRPDVSGKKRAANRANAQKSTGPRTAEGKARVAMNAVLHQQTMRLVAAPGESASQFVLFAKLVRADLRPQNFVQTLLVERAIDLLWKLRRVQAAQLEFYATEVGELRELMDEHERGGKSTENLEPLLRPGCVLLNAVERSGGKQGAYLRLDLYADRLQRALTSVLLRLRQDQERTGPGRGPRDREFRLRALRREVRRGYGGCLEGDVGAEGAESLSKPTEGGGAASPGSSASPDAAVPYDPAAQAVGDPAENADRQNKATEPPPGASFPGNGEPSMN